MSPVEDQIAVNTSTTIIQINNGGSLGRPFSVHASLTTVLEEIAVAGRHLTCQIRTLTDDIVYEARCITDASGVAHFLSIILEDVHEIIEDVEYYICVVFDAIESLFGGSRDCQTVPFNNIHKTVTALSLSTPGAIQSGETFTASIELESDIQLHVGDDNYYLNQPITLSKSVDGGSTWSEIGSGTTDWNGMVYIQVTQDAIGTDIYARYRANYAGSAYLTAATSNVETTHVKAVRQCFVSATTTPQPLTGKPYNVTFKAEYFIGFLGATKGIPLIVNDRSPLVGYVMSFYTYTMETTEATATPIYTHVRDVITDGGGMATVSFEDLNPVRRYVKASIAYQPFEDRMLSGCSATVVIGVLPNPAQKQVAPGLPLSQIGQGTIVGVNPGTSADLPAAGKALTGTDQVVFLVTCTLSGTTWRADTPTKGNCIYFDTDDITWDEEPNWDERQIAGRSTKGLTFLNGVGNTISFTAALNDFSAAKQPLGTVDAIHKLMQQWNRTGQILQFVSSYHNESVMVVLRQYQKVAPIAYSTDNYYDLTIKLSEFAPIMIQYEALG